MDNYIWIQLKDQFNRSKENDVVSYSSWMSADKMRYLNVLVKLGYIKRTFAYDRCTQSGTFQKVKSIPDDLRWMDAQKEAKALNISLKKDVKKYTLWNHVSEKINSHDKETFNVNDLFPYFKYGNGVDLYICKLYKLGYIERLDRKRNYKIVEKIPENLTASLACKLLYDNIYKRARKIQLLKEKMAS